MVTATQHEGGAALFVLYLAIHVGFVAWAAAKGDGWWAVGIFLFPVVGDIAYLIYRSSTRNHERSPVTRTWDVQVGDVVQNELPIQISGTRDQIPPRTTLRVTQVGERDLVEVELANGLRHRMYTDALTLVRRGEPPVARAGPSQGVAQQSPAAPTSRYGDELRDLASLRNEGIITEEEFTAKKRQILGL